MINRFSKKDCSQSLMKHYHQSKDDLYCLETHNFFKDNTSFFNQLIYLSIPANNPGKNTD